ncbi:porin [Zoogloea sp.]|uniref:porin n=1 Tax=Zoogloea sp. TaxID=49181 RepID=UPI0025CBD107|nr:porin [Zoogloea sp.]MCK6396415.1 porin [Zoogloea sp.]
MSRHPHAHRARLLALAVAAAFAASPALAGEKELQAQIEALARQLESLQRQMAEQKAEQKAAAAAPAPTQASSGPGNFKLTVSGNLDAAIGHQGNVATSSAALQGGTTKFFNGGMAPTNLAVTGSTDIADGLTALFKVDTEFLTSSGANMLPVSGQIGPSSYNGANGSSVLFNRAAYVGLSGRYGAVNLGRQQTVAVDAVVKVEPSNYINFFMSSVYGAYNLGNAIYGQGLLNTAPGRYSAGISGNLDSRDNAMIKYTSPSMLGVRIIAGYSPGGVAGGDTQGTKAAVGASYDYGNLSLGASYTEWNPMDVVSNHDVKYRLHNLGVGYRFGPLSVRAAMGHTALPAVTLKDATNTNVSYTAADASVKGIGATYAVSPRVDVTAAYYVKRYDIASGNKPRVDTLGLAATWQLYKNTKLYALFDHASSRGDNQAAQTLGGNGSANAFAVGLSHAFSADMLR